MFLSCNLAVLMLVLTFKAQVHAGRIIGGHTVAPHSRQYMVLLQKFRSNGGTSFCGGFLLSEDFVMTAAHCRAASYKVFVGFHNFREKPKLNYSVEEEFPHEDYDAEGLKNDIMLLKLAGKVQFNNNVKPIALATQDDSTLPTSCSVSGWGQTSHDNPKMSPELMEVNVTLLEKQQCVQEKVYCSEGKVGPGQGDSGGPLVCEDGKAYGLVSGNTALQHHSMLVKYMKIPIYREWIDKIMKQKRKELLRHIY